MDLDSLERRILAIESILVLLTIASIATADYFAGPQMSLGPLYLIPISYSALSHRLPTTIFLAVVCVALRQLFGPLGNAADPWFAFVRDLGIAAVFVVAVVLLRRFGSQRRQIFELARRQRDELAREVDMGANLQQRLISLNTPPVGDLDIAAKTFPLRGVNGDYYDFIDLGDQTCGIVVADVAGKGLPAALLMPALRFATRSLIAGRGDLAGQVRQLNEEFCQTTETRHYGTLFYARFDLDSGRINYVNAGHNPPLLVEATGDWRELDTGGPPIGLLDDSDYEAGEIVLDPGAALLLYTDGITEAESPASGQLGSDPLVELLVAKRAEPADEILESVFALVSEHLGESPPTDDTTVIAIKRRS